MKKLLFIPFLAFQLNSIAQATITWQQTYGGSGGGISYAHILTADGGRVFAGNSSIESNGGSDFWIFKTNDGGDIIWEKKYGGSEDDGAYNLKQTADGGYIIVGNTYSDDGDVIGFHGPLANSDVWVLKLDPAGNLEWQKTLGGQSFDDGRSVIQTSDGGYIIAASSNSIDGDPIENKGHEDFWIIKLSASGSILWNKVYGGSKSDRAFTIEEANDGGFMIGGYAYSNDGDVSFNHGNPEDHPDGWVIKLDNNGVFEWEKSYGSTSYERITCIKKTTDGGYIMAVEAGASDGDVTSPIQGQTDAWLVKIDPDGVIQWQNTYGGTEIDYGTHVIQTQDLGYLFAVNTFSTDGDALTSNGQVEGLVIKTSNTGELQWKKTLGGSQEDYTNCASQLPDGNYLITGGTGSSDGDINVVNDGYNAWAVKLVPENLTSNDFTINNPVSIYPNPCSDILNLKYDTLFSVTEIVLCDVTGKVITQQSDNLNSIDTTHLENGIYFVNLLSNTTEYKLKFIKN